MGVLTIPGNPKMAHGVTNVAVECETGQVSDGYHTFDELYDHRCLLFVTLLNLLARKNDGTAWKSKQHSDGETWEGWFIAGLDTPEGMITYHIPEKYGVLVDADCEIERGKVWDGHTSADVIERLCKWNASGL